MAEEHDPWDEEGDDIAEATTWLADYMIKLDETKSSSLPDRRDPSTSDIDSGLGGRLGSQVDKIIKKGISNERKDAITQFRDKIKPDEKVGWFIIFNGDPERTVVDDDEESEEDDDDDTEADSYSATEGSSYRDSGEVS